MASFAGGKIEAFVGPSELGAADDLEQVIVDFIRGARSSLDIAVQEIDSRAIAQAILDARWRGVRVHIFLEQDYLRSDLVGSPPKAPTPRPGETPEQALHRVQWLKDETDLAVNREILAALLRSDIEIKGDYNPTGVDIGRANAMTEGRDLRELTEVMLATFADLSNLDPEAMKVGLEGARQLVTRAEPTTPEAIAESAGVRIQRVREILGDFAERGCCSSTRTAVSPPCGQ